MIKIHDLQILHNIPFEEYLQLPGVSYSFIKSNGKSFSPTSKMQLGSDVDNYMNDSANFTGNVKLIKPLANLLTSEIGDLYKVVEKQVVITCVMEFAGFVMYYRGRIDWKIRKLLIIDTKVAEDIERTIAFYGYEHQISGYCIPLGIPIGIILGVSPTKIDKKTGLNQVKRFAFRTKASWWEQQIPKHGRKIELNSVHY